MIQKLVWENIRHRPIRTLLSVLLIGVPVTLILTLVGLSRGMLSDAQTRARGIGADIAIRPQSSSLMTFSSATIPEQFVAALAKKPHVVLSTATVVRPISGLMESVTGIDPAVFERMSGGFVFEEGHGFRNPNDILVDSYYARQKKLQAGSTFNVLNRDWNVAGVVEPGKLSHVFLPMKILQQLTGTNGYVSQIYLKLDDPRNIAGVIADLKRSLVSYPVYAMSDLISLISMDNVPALKPFIQVIVGIAVIIAFAVVCLSMYMAVLQRTREIGILKSLGASKMMILEIILAEALIVGFGGTVLGVLFSFTTRWLLLRIVPASLPQAIVYDWWFYAGLIAMGAAILGAMYPGMKAAQQDPIEALAYE